MAVVLRAHAHGSFNHLLIRPCPTARLPSACPMLSVQPNPARVAITEEQIIGVLREQEAGARTEEVCRRHGISSATFYKWKAKYGRPGGLGRQAAEGAGG